MNTSTDRKQDALNINPRNALHSSTFPSYRCLIKDFELRPNVLDLLQHVFIKQIVGREKVLQKQLIELIDLNQQIGVIEKTRYRLFSFSPVSHIPMLCMRRAGSCAAFLAALAEY